MLLLHSPTLPHSEPAALHLLGLSISNCAEQALQVKGGGQVLLQDMKLTGHNAPQGDGQLGGAVLVERTQKVRLEASACSSCSACGNACT